MKFKVGDVVIAGQGMIDKINRNRYFSGPLNPIGIAGVVLSFNENWDDLPYKVEWSNGRTNFYDEEDLEFFTSDMSIEDIIG
jgi:hypothetical protein